MVKNCRPQKLYTGRKGRPTKVKSTRKDHAVAMAKRLGRKPIGKPDGQATDDPMEVDVNSG